MAPLFGTCPRCRAVAPIGALLADGESAAAWARLEARYAPHRALLARVLRYLDLHAPEASRIHGPKLVRLLDELADLIGKDAALPPGVWALAMDEALDQAQTGKLRLPLQDGFGWLKSVAAAVAADPVRRAAAEALARAPAPAAAAVPEAPSPEDDKRELVADLTHWSRLAAAGAPGAAAEVERLRARFLQLTGRYWGEGA